MSVVGLITLITLSASSSRAQDEPLRLMREPGSFTDVIDAADDQDGYDLNVRLAFRRSRETGTISRQSPSIVPGTGEVADYDHRRNVLEVGLDLGVYKDVALYARLPLVLVDSRSLSAPSGAPSTVPGFGGEADSLFSLPFDSVERSGLESLSVGLAFSPMNQGRRRWQPTWTMLLEGRFAIGELMEPCQEEEGTGCGNGMSEGSHAFRFENRLSRRYRYAELYGGLGYELAWAGRAEGRFSPGGDLAGFVHQRPPMRGHLTAGVEIIPWEERMKWQRLSFDIRAMGTYVSEGRDYSILYDALGTSTHPQLRSPNFEGIQPPGGTLDLRQVPFNGLTDVQAHGEVGGTLAVEMQAARYVRFRFATHFMYVTPHHLTYSDACNTSESPVGPNDPRIGAIAGPEGPVGGCTDGILDPHYRSVIDAPGQRFRIDNVFRMTFFVQATAQF